MNNVFKIAQESLENKVSILKQELDELYNLKHEEGKVRIENLFDSILEKWPCVEMTTHNRWEDSIKFYRGGKEILSITKSYNDPSMYLNVYSSWANNEYELKRLMFCGQVAEFVLYNPDLYDKIFSPYSQDEQISNKIVELNKAETELSSIRTKLHNDQQEINLNRIKNGEVIIFEKPTTVWYGLGKYASIHRVESFKAKMTTKNKADVEFQVKWHGEEHTTHKVSGILVKHLVNYVK